MVDVTDSYTLQKELELERLKQLVERLEIERNHARAQFDGAVNLLCGIHALTYPAPVTTPDGRTWVLRPTDPDPHEILQELSDRIRALPDELLALRTQPKKPQS